MKNSQTPVINLGNSQLSVDQAIERAIKVSAKVFDQANQPDISAVKKLILQKGKYVIKFVTCWDIRSRNTGNHKFSNLVFYTLRKTKKRGWEFEIRRSITLGDENNTNIAEHLITFLSSLSSVNTSGDVIIINPKDVDVKKFGQMLLALSGTTRKTDVLSEILSWLNKDQQAFESLAQLSSDNPLRSRSLSAAINYGRYYRKLERFQELVNQNLPEKIYQTFLEENSWMFGSEYSELLPIRSLVVGQQLDFPLRRTVDGYIDVIEIKTPLDGASGFIYDKSHKNYYAGSDIYKYSAQVRNYISSLEAERYRIKSVDNIDVSKIRGKLVIGREGITAEEEARRLLNADARAVEVISFDGIIKIAQRILNIMVSENPSLADFELDHNNNAS